MTHRCTLTRLADARHPLPLRGRGIHRRVWCLSTENRPLGGLGGARRRRAAWWFI